MYCDYRKDTAKELSDLLKEDERKLLAAALNKINDFYSDKLSEKEAEEFEF